MTPYERLRDRWAKHSQTQRGIWQGLSRGLFGYGQAPDTMAGQTIFHALQGTRQVTALALSGMANAAVNSRSILRGAAMAPLHLTDGYLNWRGNLATELRKNQRLADKYYREGVPIAERDTAGRIANKYGRQIDEFGNLGARKFGMRTPAQHLRKGASNFAKFSVLSPLAWGLHAGFAALTSGDNLMDPKTGLAPMLAQSVASEIGFVGGGAVGAAIGSSLAPGTAIGTVAAGVGFLGMAFGGAILATKAIEGVHALSDWGLKYGRHSKPFRSTFLDSEQAATMRQRAVQSIYRSQMNCRSAFGSEALAYHG